ncbi:MAG: hydrolase [Deltaproteobacteria bacterium]|nr:hydrolase [Deltaproteobacteria bacterium]
MVCYKRFFLDIDKLLVVSIDIQEGLLKAMPLEIQNLIIRNSKIILKACELFKIPVIFTEQYPKGLGQTIPQIKKIVDNFSAIEKISFSCLKEENFVKKFNQYKRNQILLIGIETHVCIMQTALDLIKRGYYPYIVADCVASRTKENWRIALDQLKEAGAIITTTEIVVFELLKKAGTKEFKILSPLIK